MGQSEKPGDCSGVVFSVTMSIYVANMLWFVIAVVGMIYLFPTLYIYPMVVLVGGGLILVLHSGFRVVWSVGRPRDETLLELLLSQLAQSTYISTVVVSLPFIGWAADLLRRDSVSVFILLILVGFPQLLAECVRVSTMGFLYRHNGVHYPILIPLKWTLTLMVLCTVGIVSMAVSSPFPAGFNVFLVNQITVTTLRALLEDMAILYCLRRFLEKDPPSPSVCWPVDGDDIKNRRRLDMLILYLDLVHWILLFVGVVWWRVSLA